MGDDLISRNALLEELKDFRMTITGQVNARAIMEETKKSITRIINEQPVAYDVDKVSEQLEKLTIDITDNAEKIRSMTDEELAKSRIDRIDFYCKSNTQMWTGDFNGVAESEEKALELEMEWLHMRCDNNET